MKNPSTMYCQALGYQYETTENENGDTVGICRLPGNMDCNSWDFMSGKCGIEYSYCAKMGYQQRTATGAECGSEDLLAECLLCVLPDGKTAEVSGLMDLNVEEGVCGDGVCVMGETYESCPQDCLENPTTMEPVSTFPPEETTFRAVTTLLPESTTLPQETTTTPPEATTLPASTIPESVCGNSVCELSESVDSCPVDCPKTGGLEDYLLYIVLVVVLVVIAFVIKRKTDEKKIEKEREEFEKWKQEKGGSRL